MEEELRGAQELLAEVMAASDKSGGIPGGQLEGLDRLLEEVETLRLRMAEASAEAAGEASSPAKVLEALDASDARLQVSLPPPPPPPSSSPPPQTFTSSCASSCCS